jgi:hypothetical protein
MHADRIVCVEEDVDLIRLKTRRGDVSDEQAITGEVEMLEGS